VAGKALTAVAIAVGVNSDGRREVLVMVIGASEAGAFWTNVPRSLVKLVISDAHEGISILGKVEGAEAHLTAAEAEKGARNTLTSWYWRLAVAWGCRSMIARVQSPCPTDRTAPSK
jgi:hypothetical protein